MSNKYKPNEMEQEFLTSVKSISISLKEIKEQFIIKNKIDSIRIAFNLTDNKTFSTLTKEQSKKVMREVNGQLNNIEEKPTFDYLVNTGLYILKPELLKLIPKNKYFDMTDLINAAKKRKKKIGVFPIDENEWVDVGQWEEYEKAKSRLE